MQDDIYDAAICPPPPAPGHHTHTYTLVIAEYYSAVNFVPSRQRARNTFRQLFPTCPLRSLRTPLQSGTLVYKESPRLCRADSLFPSYKVAQPSSMCIAHYPFRVSAQSKEEDKRSLVSFSYHVNWADSLVHTRWVELWRPGLSKDEVLSYSD